MTRDIGAWILILTAILIFGRLWFNLVECVGSPGFALIGFPFESYRTISTSRLTGSFRRQSSHQGNGPLWWDSSHTALLPRSRSPSPRFGETE